MTIVIGDNPNPAQDGTDATGVTPPAGATGIRGWLSVIAATVPTSAVQGSPTAGQTGHLMQGAVTASPPSYTTAQTSPLSLDTAGNLRVNVVAGGGGASGNVAQGSATAGETGVMIQGAVTASPPSYTTAQTSPLSLDTAGNLRVNVVAGGGGASGNVAQGSATAGETGVMIQGAVTASPPSYTTAQTSPLSLDTAGNLRVNVVAGGGGASGNVAQGSATAGETGVMIQGAVTAAAPSYTAAQTSPISLTTAGAVRTDASATTQPVSAASLPLPAGAAQDGTDGTGITPPGGGVGIRGWLSGIFNKLNTSIGVTGTFWQATQPVSAASLPLPVGAATAAGLTTINTTLGTPMQATGGTVGIAAGTNAIGSIIGRTTMVTATPAVTSNGAYGAGNEIGGLMTFAIGGAGSGTLMSMRVTSRSVLTTALKAYIFSANPLNTTWTDKTAPAIKAADIASLLTVIPLNAPDSGLGTHTLWESSGIAAQFVAANLYVVLVTVSAATLTSGTASDFTVQLGVSDD